MQTVRLDPAMPDPSPLARCVLAQLEAVADQAPEPRRLTVAELGLDRRVLDGTLGELDDLGLIRGGFSTRDSHVEPTEPRPSLPSGHERPEVS